MSQDSASLIMQPPPEEWVLSCNLTFSDGADVDRAVWTSPQWTPTNNASFFGRTSIRNPTDYGPAIGCVPVQNGRAQLQLSTWNPLDNTNGSFLGAQISTIRKWGLASYAGVRFEARVQCPPDVPAGAVASLFSYNLLSADPFQHDEIDFEFASKHWQAPGQKVNTNVYVDDNSGLDLVVDTVADFSGPIDFAIEWTAEGIHWYIDGVLVRTCGSVPQSDMSLTLNFWVPDGGWAWAYDAGLQPSGAPGTQWTYQVEWAKVYVRGQKNVTWM